MSTITIGGQERPFRIGYRSIRAARKLHNIEIKLADLQALDGKGIADQVDAFVQLLHVGLLHGDKDLKVAQVEDWIDTDDAFDDRSATGLIVQQIQELFNPPAKPGPRK